MKSKTTTPDEIKNFFSLPIREAKEIKDEVIIIAKPLSDIQGTECIACDSTGKCPDCDGTGDVEHVCSCELCELAYEDCIQCDGKGKCQECDGTGYC